LVLTAAAHAQREPLPVGKSIELKEDGRRYTVEGRVRIAGDTSIGVLKAAEIEGLGQDAVIELSGALSLKANLGGKVELENVWIELQPDARELALSDVRFRSGGVRCTERGVRAPKILAVEAWFQAKAGFDLAVYGGEIDLQQCSFSLPLSIKGLAESDKIPNKTDLELIGARGIHLGLTIDGVKNVTVRHCDIAGDLALLSNWGKLTFDGNNVRTPRIEFAQPAYGRFSGATVIKNCDFHCDEITFKCPTDGDKAEKFTLDHNWYRGLTDTKAIVERIVVDHTRFPRVGIEIDCKRTTKGRLGLGGSTER
jgi:hypothetical protein